MKSSIAVLKRNASLFKIVNLFNNSYLTVYTVLTLFQSSAGQYFNEPFTNFPVNQGPGSFVYPPIANFPVTPTPYYGSQFTLANYFPPMAQQSSPFVQPPTTSHWNHPQLASNSESNDARANLPFRGSNSDSNADRGKDIVEGEENPNPKITDNHEKQAEKNTENMWPSDSKLTTDRRFGLLSKLWNKKKAKKQSTKHKHDHFYHQNVHHHHHHHHYHHHIHHYPGGKPNRFKSAMKKLKYKWKFKSQIKEIGEAPPTQHIYDQPPQVQQPYPDPPPYTVHHHHPGHNGYW